MTANPDSSGTAEVIFAPPTGSGGTPPLAVSCMPESGSKVPVGSNTVTCSVSDSGGRVAGCTFRVEVAPGRVLRKTRFVAFGDSITEGYLREPPDLEYGRYAQLVIESETYPFKLEQLLRGTFVSQEISVHNAGKGGETTAEGLDRLLGVLNRTKPEVLLLLEGYNGLTRTDTTSIRADLRRLVRTAQVRNVEVLLATLFKVRERREEARPGTNEAISALNRQIRQLAAELKLGPVVDLEAAFAGDEKSLIGPDHLHPTPAGYQRIAETFFEAIVARYEDSETASSP